MTETKKRRKKRAGISKRARFEVLKRDGFTCQYCGAAAPDVVLQIDHIEPVSKGGSNSILNLVTSCQACNSGKGAVPLSDTTAIATQKRQLNELQARREQLEMMSRWRKSLISEGKKEADLALEEWHRLFPGWTNGCEEPALTCLVRKHGLGLVLDAIAGTQETYADFETNDDGEARVTQEAYEKGWKKLGAVCWVKANEKSRPNLKDAAYLKGIARRRFGNHQCSWLAGGLEECLDRGVSFGDLKDLLVSCDEIDDVLEAITHQREAGDQ